MFADVFFERLFCGQPSAPMIAADQSETALSVHDRLSDSIYCSGNLAFCCRRHKSNEHDRILLATCRRRCKGRVQSRQILAGSSKLGQMFGRRRFALALLLEQGRGGLDEDAKGATKPFRKAATTLKRSSCMDCASTKSAALKLQRNGTCTRRAPLVASLRPWRLFRKATQMACTHAECLEGTDVWKDCAALFYYRRRLCRCWSFAVAIRPKPHRQACISHSDPVT